MNKEKNIAYILTGSNVGNREEMLFRAIELLSVSAGKVINKSGIYETAAWGNHNQEDFLNQVLVIETAFSAPDLMKLILEIETAMGRVRTKKNAPRKIDIDILFFNRDIIQSKLVEVPHPAIQDRRFVLIPLHELDPGYIHPVFLKSIETLLLECKDPLTVRMYKPSK